MAMLVLVNGPPASGKSTVVDRLVATRPLALRLDIDVVRGLLGAWLDEPIRAGLAARTLALAMARPHLAAGHDVFVPQFLGRPDFIEELAELALEVGVVFHEIALVLERDAALAAFAERRADPTDPTHRDAAALIDRSTSPRPVAEMFDRYEQLLTERPDAVQVPVTRGRIDDTVMRVERALASSDSAGAAP